MANTVFFRGREHNGRTQLLAFNPDHIVRWTYAPPFPGKASTLKVTCTDGDPVTLYGQEAAPVLAWLLQHAMEWEGDDAPEQP